MKSGLAALLLALSMVAGAAERSTFVAFRFDQTRVYFSVDDADLPIGDGGQLRNLGDPVARFGPPLGAPDAAYVQRYREKFDRVRVGEEWQLEVSAGLRVGVVVREPVVVDVGCEAFAAYLAEVVPSQRAEFSASSKQYFVIHKENSGWARKPTQAGELPDWKATPKFRSQLEGLLRDRMNTELPRVLARIKEEYERQPGTVAAHWKPMDAKLARGEGKLEYDMHAFRLMPDGAPRVFVRAKWTIDGEPAFLMSAWVRAQSGLTVEAVQSAVSEYLRISEFQHLRLDLEWLGTVVNVFDRTGDGHGELLMFGLGYESGGFDLLRYTEAGPVRDGVEFNWGC